MLAPFQTDLALPAVLGESRSVRDLEAQASGLIQQLNHELVHRTLVYLLQNTKGLLGLWVPCVSNLRLTDIGGHWSTEVDEAKQERSLQKSLVGLRKLVFYPKRNKDFLIEMFNHLNDFRVNPKDPQVNLMPKDSLYRQFGSYYLKASEWEQYWAAAVSPGVLAVERAKTLSQRPANALRARPRA